MTSCWYEDSEERPSFDELAAELEKVLSTMVGYVELNMELVAITEDEHSKQLIVHSERRRCHFCYRCVFQYETVCCQSCTIMECLLIVCTCS